MSIDTINQNGNNLENNLVKDYINLADLAPTRNEAIKKIAMIAENKKKLGKKI
ncbi:MAG: hypothetical protein GX362_03800 [Methanosarcinaceae archaeon]|nr:hypothetical protein [Methanosarcinaceae archaeon]